MNIERISKSIVCSLLLIGFVFAEINFFKEVERASKPITVTVADGKLQDKYASDVWCPDVTELVCKRYIFMVNEKPIIVTLDTYNKAKIGQHVVLTVDKEGDSLYPDSGFKQLFFALPMSLINFGGAVLILASFIVVSIPFIWWSMFHANSKEFKPYLKQFWSSD